ncbi:MAG: alkane 1-monooxygenase [Flavobacteriales bacterium]|nr:alkane 1-monooxygenase [Flavobacteriales bacterium]MDW8432893.1 alkane 1-monooxygenase [Flavobacteriales bacterium]
MKSILKRDWKYLYAYLIPVLGFLAFHRGGAFTFLLPFVAFVLIPVLEYYLPFDYRNIPEDLEDSRQSHRFFDVLLYVNIPLFWLLMGMYLVRLSRVPMSWWEVMGSAWTAAILCGVMGINLAHELGHHARPLDRFLSRFQLLGCLYMHFYIEHNRGHHRYVSTPRDPASAPQGMDVYRFWWRSVSGSLRSAWELEVQRLKNEGKRVWSWHNEMLWYVFFQTALLVLVGIVFGAKGLLAFLAAAVGGILLLETVNYIEHYGLRRKEVRPGLYESVKPYHSWNSEHVLGRILLYELTRHSDHHYKASRKYQNLRYFEQTPQLPLGYPGSMWLSLLPPLWFRRMDPLVARWQKQAG